MSRSRLQEVYDVLHSVEEMNSDDQEALSLLRRPELGVTFTKLHAWRLVSFEKVLFLDADILVKKNLDAVFSRLDLSVSMAGDPGLRLAHSPCVNETGRQTLPLRQMLDGPTASTAG